MVSYYIGDGNTNLGSDPNSGDEFILVPVQLDHSWDQGNFGFPFPLNARIYSSVRVLGSPSGLGDGLPLRAAGPQPLNFAAMLVFGAGFGNEGFTVNAEVATNPLIETMVVVMNGVRLAIFLAETVVFAVDMPGEFPLFRVPPLTREYFAERDGVRPSFPWLIERVVKHHGEVVVNGVFQFDVDVPFLVHEDFTPENDPILGGYGARANHIGMVVEVTRPDDTIATTVRFRAPEEFEVVAVRNP
jgi:hypothetical protein